MIKKYCEFFIILFQHKGMIMDIIILSNPFFPHSTHNTGNIHVNIRCVIMIWIYMTIHALICINIMHDIQGATGTLV